MESDRLVHTIRQSIRETELARLRILPTDADIAERCARDYPRDERRARGEAMRRAISVILQAYERVLEDGDAPEKVYEELLKDQMSREEWIQRVEHDMTKKSIRNMRGALDRTPEELFNCKALMQQLIVMEREGPAIDKEIARLDAEYADYLRLASEDPRSPMLRDKGPMYRQARRYQWWLEQYKRADIKMLDPRFAQVPDKVRSAR